MVLRQAHQNVSIGWPDGRGGTVGKIDAAVRQANIVDDAADLIRRNLIANGLFHQVSQSRGLFNACSSARPQMQFELAAVDSREEVLAQPGDQQHKRSKANCKEADDKRATMMQAALQ